MILGERCTCRYLGPDARSPETGIIRLPLPPRPTGGRGAISEAHARPLGGGSCGLGLRHPRGTPRALHPPPGPGACPPKCREARARAPLCGSLAAASAAPSSPFILLVDVLALGLCARVAASCIARTIEGAEGRPSHLLDDLSRVFHLHASAIDGSACGFIDLKEWHPHGRASRRNGDGANQVC